MENRRIFTRILFAINARLTIEQVDYPVTLHDISMSGALVKSTTKDIALNKKEGLLHFSLDDDNSTVSMQVTIVHENTTNTDGNFNTEIGLHCDSIDLNSISVLRRLIELNLGDSEQLNKELSQLSYSHDVA